MTIHRTISEGLIYPSDFFDILDMGGLSPEIVLDEAGIRAHITEIRRILEEEGDRYEMTDEEMIKEILQIKEMVNNGKG